MSDADASATLDSMKQAGRRDFVITANAALDALAEKAGVPFRNGHGRTGGEQYADPKTRTKARDWIVVARGGGSFQFFNVRTSSLRDGGDLDCIEAGYPKRKVVEPATGNSWRYRLTRGRMFYRRAVKRVHWAHKRLELRLGRPRSTVK